ncbi:MAG: polyprenyl synthetase family protein [Saprospiraceae bacterium]
MPQTGQSLQYLLAQFQEYAANQQFNLQPPTLYDPIRYAMGSKGKAVRPLLLLLGASLGNADLQKALPAAYAVELFHNFTLLHDDIMDEAPLRRGKPSVHTKFGVASAILAGDAMMIHTYGYLLDNYEGATGSYLLKVFQAMAIGLCEGQQRDMDMEVSEVSTYTEYLEMIHGKTGVLITACLEMGAFIGGLSPKQCETIRKVGDLAGRAFQIQDDVLDTFSTSKQTGKSDYGDIVRGKQSAPFLHALQSASPTQQERLKEIYALTVEERSILIPEVLSIMQDLGVEKSLATQVEAASSEANMLVESLQVDEEAKANLISFLDKLSVRRH